MSASRELIDAVMSDFRARHHLPQEETDQQKLYAEGQAREPDGRFAGEGSSIGALHSHLIDYKVTERALTGKGSKPITKTVVGSHAVNYFNVPGLGEMHQAMGMHPTLETDPRAYVATRDVLFNRLPVEKVAVSDLTFTQPRINQPNIDTMLAEPSRLDQPVQVMKVGDKSYLMNGHHRVVAAHLAGMTHINAHVFHAPSSRHQHFPMSAELVRFLVIDSDLEQVQLYSPDQERDDHGRFSGSGMITAKKVDEIRTRLGPEPRKPPTDPVIGPHAKAVYEKSSKIAGPLTAQMHDIAKATGGTLTRLEVMVDGEMKSTVQKSEGSIGRKIADYFAEGNGKITHEDAAKMVGDGVRYTMTFPEDATTQGALDVIGKMAASGWTKYDDKFKNYFADGENVYKGINLNFEKDGQIIEMQIHTPQSLDVAEKNHSIYELERRLPKGDPAKAQLQRLMQKNARSVKLPTNADIIPGLRAMKTGK